MEKLRTLENGHKQCTTCVETTYHDNCVIITGAEKGELCLWSKDGNLIKNLKLKKRDDVSAIACVRSNPDKFFVSAYRQVFSFDIRQLDKPLEKIAYAGDCINQIAIDNSETILAFAQDSGEVEIFDFHQKSFVAVLEEHNNLCNTVTFQNDTNRLFSGGMDNLLLEWNINKNRVEKRVDMAELGAYSEDMGSLPFFVVSPPFIHSISVSHSGYHLACGTENAMVYLFDISNNNLRCLQSYRSHNKAVSQVHFPKFSNEVFYSTGNDMRLCAWKIPKYSDDGDIFCEDQVKINEGLSSPCLEMKTTSKINWISSGIDGAKGFLVMVDGSPTPTMYSFCA